MPGSFVSLSNTSNVLPEEDVPFFRQEPLTSISKIYPETYFPLHLPVRQDLPSKLLLVKHQFTILGTR
jgi:hypothetical protein